MPRGALFRGYPEKFMDLTRDCGARGISVAETFESVSERIDSIETMEVVTDETGEMERSSPAQETIWGAMVRRAEMR